MGPERTIAREPAVGAVQPVRAPDRGPAAVQRDLRGIARLQGAAGNRAVAALLAGRTIQRHVGPTEPAETMTPGTGTGTDTATGPDYGALAAQVRDAIEGLGTDEEAVYGALGMLGRDPVKIAVMRVTYAVLTGRSLDEDIDDDFSGEELARARRLLTPVSRQEMIETEMRRTTSGRWALEVIETHSVTVDWAYTGRGSFHQAGTIHLNQNEGAVSGAITMMHEAQHALTFRTGRAADAAALSRGDFIRAKIADEAEAVVRSFEGAGEASASGTDVSAGVNASLLTQYQQALAAEVTRITTAEPGVSAEVARARARTTVRDGLVTGWFSDGTFVTSTGLISYADHYGNYWDSVHAPPATPPTLPATAPSVVVNA